MRVHFGVSFSWKQIKKVIIPILIAIAVFLGLESVNAEEVYTILYGTKATSVNPTSLPVVWNESVQMVPSSQQLPVYIVNNTGTQFDSYYIRGFNISFLSPVAKRGKSYTIKARFRIKSKGLIYTDNISSVMTPVLVYEQQPDKIKDKSTTYSYYVNDDGSVDFTISSIVNLTENVDLSTIYLSFYNNNGFNGSNYDQWYFMKCWPNELGVCRDTDFYSQLILLDVESSISEDLNTTLLNGINDSINSGTNSIINNNNQNTQDIINNNNQNTQDIINNNNQNTQDFIESQKVCKTIDISDTIVDGYLGLQNGVLDSSQYSRVTDFIDVTDATIKKLSQPSERNNALCFYDSNKNFISCLSREQYANLSVIPIPSNSRYVRFTISILENKPTFSFCSNGNQIIQDTLTDSNVDSGSANDFFTNFEDNDFGLSGIVKSPLVLIQGLTNGSSCVNLNLNVLGKNVSMPSGCILWNKVPPNIETIYFVFIGGFLAYILGTKLFHDVNDLKNPEKSEVSTLDL